MDREDMIDFINERMDNVCSIIESSKYIEESFKNELKQNRALKSFLAYLKKHNPDKAKKYAKNIKSAINEAKRNTPDFCEWAKKNPKHAAVLHVGIGMSKNATTNYMITMQAQTVGKAVKDYKANVADIKKRLNKK